MPSPVSPHESPPFALKSRINFRVFDEGPQFCGCTLMWSVAATGCENRQARYTEGVGSDFLGSARSHSLSQPMAGLLAFTPRKCHWHGALLALISRQKELYLAAKLLGSGITARRYVVSSWQQNETCARDAARKGSPDVERSDAIALNL